MCMFTISTRGNLTYKYTTGAPEHADESAHLHVFSNILLAMDSMELIVHLPTLTLVVYTNQLYHVLI